MNSHTIAGVTAAALGLAVLASCSVTEVAPASRLEPPAGQGTVIVALTRSGDVDSSVWLLLRKDGNTFPVQMLLDDWFVRRDWTQLKSAQRFNQFNYAAPDAPIGRLAVLQLAAGDYEIYRWRGDTVGQMRGGFMYSLSSAPFSLRFTVRPGAVTYLGGWQLTLPEQIFTTQGRGTFRIDTKESAERDFALLKSKYPAAANAQIVMAPPSGSISGEFYVHPVDFGSSDFSE